ncbi:hypothetical protein EWM64_g3365 [Hericium alpestre]|uniref:T6SS Phospholipase effector Tle1-like catalytic domain-containing protein n=1 Tax=Hericium alpestre TaxID=135208 RepID=A0A4Z0A351_9AGAM|nr:hypothetical protein EWM64_g3365 [Hericium alpestre]
MSGTMDAGVAEITSRDGFDSMIAILIVYQTSTKPSLTIFPVFESYAKQHPENAVYYKLDADKYDITKVSDKMRGVTNFPTFLAFKNGRKIGELVGAHVPKLRNMNVVELYHLLQKDNRQLTYYDSGVGTYAKPTFRPFSPSHWKRAIANKVDMAVAWRFEDIILRAYRWLAENYDEGDYIFLFLCALSAMIYTVGLIHKGNEAQIPFAYKLYASVEDSSYLDDMVLRMQQSIGTVQRPRSGEHFPDTHAKSRFMADNFKATFSRSVQVHFVGAWDTVSSVGLVRNKTLPFTARGMGHVCYFRHGLALDERRVKFLPEYAYGGISKSEPPKASLEKYLDVPQAGKHLDVPPMTCERGPFLTIVYDAKLTVTRRGGGNVSNMQLNRSQPALRWMSYEAVKAGLFMHSFKGYLALENTPQIHESLKHAWWIFELLVPVRQLSYKGQNDTTRAPQGREAKTPAWEDFKLETSKVGSESPLEKDVLGTVYYLAEQCKRCSDSDAAEVKRIRRALKTFMATEEAGRAMHEAADVSKTFIDFYARLPQKSASSIPIHLVDDIRLLPPVLHAKQKTAIDVHFVKKDDAMLILEPIVSVGSELAPPGDRGIDELDHVQLKYKKAAAAESRLDRSLDVILKNVLEELGLERHYSTVNGFIVCRMAFGNEQNLDKL